MEPLDPAQNRYAPRNIAALHILSLIHFLFAGPPEASHQTAESRPCTTPSVPSINQQSPSTDGGADDQGHGVSAAEPETESSMKESDKLSSKLWNQAYDELEKAEAKLVDDYVKVLAEALAKDIIAAQREENEDAAASHSEERKYLKSLTAQVLADLDSSKEQKPAEGASSESTSAQDQTAIDDTSVEGSSAQEQTLVGDATIDGSSAQDQTTVGDASAESSSAQDQAPVVGSSTTGASELDQLAAGILAKLKDPTKRQLFLEMLVTSGKARVKKTERVSKAAGYVAEKVLFLKPAMEVVLQIPQAAPAALPWAGICLGMKILSHPAEAAQAQRDGFSFVASRMEWYYAMTSDLLDYDSKPNMDENSSSKLTNKLCELYKAILHYQILSVCYYYSNPFRQWYGSVDWKASKTAVEDAESVFVKDWDFYKKVESRNLWRDIRQKAENRNSLLQDMVHTLKDYFSAQEDRAAKDESRQYIRDLCVVDPETEMDDLAKKRGGFDEKICEWVLNHPKYTAFTTWQDNDADPDLTIWDSSAFSLHGRLLWIQGPAGTGKTKLMICIVRNLLARRKVLWPNLAYFFCQSTKKNQRTGAAIVRSLLWMLLIQQPNLIEYIERKFKWSNKNKFDSDTAIMSLSQVFAAVSGDTAPVYFLVDALDECEDDQQAIIELISTSLKVSNNIRWLVTSRTEVDLRKIVARAIAKGSISIAQTNDLLTEAGSEALHIHHEPGYTVLDEIDIRNQTGRDKMYIDYRLETLTQDDQLEYDDMHCKLVTKEMLRRAEDNLVWLEVVFDSIEDMRAEFALEEIKKAPRGLKQLYGHKMKQIQQLENREHRQRCYDVMMAVSLAYSLPISIKELQILVPWSPDVLRSQRQCSAFLTASRIKESKMTMIDFNHKTARDYLTEHGKSLVEGTVRGHQDIVRNSINGLASEKRDVFKINRWKLGTMTALQTEDLASIRYSLIFWLDHLCEAIDRDLIVPDDRIALCDVAHQFLKVHLLHMLEGLAHFDQIGAIVSSFRKLVQVLEPTPDSNSDAEHNFADFLRHAEKFTVAYMPDITREPLETYSTALTFCPTKCKMKELFWSSQRAPILKSVKGIQEDWDMSLLQALDGHTGYASSLTFSRDGTLASASEEDGSIRLWNLEAGREAKILCADQPGVQSIAFSHDGEQIAAVWGKGLLRLWNLATEETTEIHTDQMSHSIAFSPDGTFACGLLDGTIRIWNPATLDETKILSRHEGAVYAITFSSDGKKLASIGDDDTLKIWDTFSASELRPELRISHTSLFNRPCQPAFMPDDQSLLVCSDGKVMRWDLTSGESTQLIDSQDGVEIESFILSPDGTQIATATINDRLELWDLTNGSMIQRPSTSYSMAYSPDGKMIASASATFDGTIRLWDSRRAMTVEASSQSYDTAVSAVAFSPDGEHLASTSWDNSIRIQNAVTGTEVVPPLQGHSSTVYMLSYSPRGEQLASSSDDGTIRLWNTTTGYSFERTLPVAREPIRAISYSSDGKTLLSGSFHGQIQLWDPSTGLNSLTFWCDGNLIYDVALSPNGPAEDGRS
ncbi:hypothetical protein NLG97_g6016 [Lecanicillium saksenae]|uniref:Uncharacterized protein n=1 Tax=Lecanicillium saksenae TaxID=468837 RepID=A0ACC1QSJ7_9HYPO|nr:hypothetical protein NLG97_g6016 [Lecanicillium saksenae]